MRQVLFIAALLAAVPAYAQVSYPPPMSGGSGSVTSFSSGSAAPFFSTTVANAGTTPALSFQLSSQAANCVFAGPTSGASASPTCRSLTSTDIPALPYDASGAAAAVQAASLQAANNLHDLASASTARTNLGLGTAATANTAAFDAAGAAVSAQAAAVLASAPRNSLFYVSAYTTTGSGSSTSTDFDQAVAAALAYTAANYASTGVEGSVVLKPLINSTCQDAAVTGINIFGRAEQTYVVQKMAGCTAASVATLYHANTLNATTHAVTQYRSVWSGFSVDANHIDPEAIQFDGTTDGTLDSVAGGNAAPGYSAEIQLGNYAVDTTYNSGWTDNLHAVNLKTFESIGVGQGDIATLSWSGTAVNSATISSSVSNHYTQYVTALVTGPGVALCVTPPTFTVQQDGSGPQQSVANIGTVSHGNLTNLTVTNAGNCSTAAQAAGIYLHFFDSAGGAQAAQIDYDNVADSYFFHTESVGQTYYGEYWSIHSSTNTTYGDHIYTGAYAQIYNNGNVNTRIGDYLDSPTGYGYIWQAQNGNDYSPRFFWNNQTATYAGAVMFQWPNGNYLDVEVNGVQCGAAPPSVTVNQFTGGQQQFIHEHGIPECDSTSNHWDAVGTEQTQSADTLNGFTQKIQSATQRVTSAFNITPGSATRTYFPWLEDFYNQFTPTSAATMQNSPALRVAMNCWVSSSSEQAAGMQIVPYPGTGQTVLQFFDQGSCGKAFEFSGGNIFTDSNGVYFGSVGSYTIGVAPDNGDLALRANSANYVSVNGDNTFSIKAPVEGSVVTQQITNPATAPTATLTGTAASSSITYATVGMDAAGDLTSLGATNAITTAPSALSASVYYTVKPAYLRGTFAYAICRVSNNIGLANGLIGTMTPITYTAGIQDTGQAPTAACPTSNATGVFVQNGRTLSPPPNTITWTASPTIPTNGGQIITLGGATTPSLGTIVPGNTLILTVCQPSGTNYSFGLMSGLHGESAVTTTAGQCTVQPFYAYNATDMVATATGVNVAAP